MEFSDSRRSYGLMVLFGLLVVVVGGVAGGVGSGHAWIAVATIGPYIGVASALLHPRFWPCHA